MKMKWTSYPYILWMIIFIVVPLALILLFSLTTGEEGGIKNLQFTFENFKRFLDSKYIDILWISISLALKSTVITLLIGYPMAMIIARERPNRRNIMILLFVIPMWMNFLLRTYAWLTLLGKNGLINYIVTRLGFSPLNLIYNDMAVLLGMVYNFLPFMVLPIYSVLIKIDKSLIEAAEDLGANKLIVFSKVTFPLSIPGIITGITMVFMPAVSTFVISRLLGGGQYMLIGNLIEQQFLWVGDWHFGSAISIIMMAFILVTIAITAKFDSQKEGGGGLW
ncbi:ABC transporter permease [Clostridium sp. Cult2]|uniref:ABC transporter permease n=1 Tax=Clostridium sp. Cult2 TaxID=2079003 RepID=UPI001F23AF05|nr:ABC transporter permease [Clostridium sp. Cult2]MCF6465723.1 ABC transporter permease [Clostridium sp. Cult2]